MKTIIKVIFLVLTLCVIILTNNSPKAHQYSELAINENKVEIDRNLDSLQNEFLDWRFGMFIHYNMAAYTNVGWSDGKEDPLLFNPKELDCKQWADAAVAANMKYGILTVKHTGGWCLWDSEYTDHDISEFKNFKDGKGDIVKEFTDAFRSRDLKVGLYYCFPLWSKQWQQYSTLPIKGYEDSSCDALSFAKNQFKELLTNYGNIDLIWIDQSNCLNGGLNEGDWLKFKSYIHSIQPNCLVIANNQLDYRDTDIHGYEYSYSLQLPPTNNTNPAEVCDKLQRGWFSNTELGVDALPVRDIDYVVNKMLIPLNYSRSNYLLNCAPNSHGLMPDSVVSFLSEVGKVWNPDMYKRDDVFIKQIVNTKNYVALTFEIDDNTNANFLSAAVKTLNKSNIRASFYVNESSTNNNIDLIKKLHASEHELGLRAETDFDIHNFNPRIFNNGLKKANKNLLSITGQKAQTIIAPNNLYNKRIWDVLNYIEMPSIGYSVLINEKQDIASGISNIKSGDIINVVINENTNNNLDLLLDELKTKRLKIITVNELVENSSDSGIKNIFSNKNKSIVTGAQ